MTQTGTNAIAAALILGVVAALSIFELPWQTQLGRAVQDAGHVFASAAMAIAALVALRSRRASSLAARLNAYALAFAIALAAGVLIEAIQLATGRGAEPADLVKDALGAGAGLAALATFDRTLLDSAQRFRGLARLGLAGLCIALAGVALTGVALWTEATRERDARFPTLLACGGVHSDRFVHVAQARFECGPAPAGFSAARGGNVGRLSLDGTPYPGLTLEEPYPDWRGFAALHLRLFLDAPEALNLTLRVHDRAHDEAQDDRFNRRLQLKPGESHIAIPLAEIEAAPRGRKLDLSAIAGLMLFGSEPAPRQPVYIDAIWLE